MNKTPPPPENLRALSMWPINQGTLLHRVHPQRYAATAFNPGGRGARFSPIQNAQGTPIPTLYGGLTLRCALMETAFHDVAHTNGFKSLDKNKLTGQVYSTLRLEQDLQLIDLTSVSLAAVGVSRIQLIDTEKDQHDDTRLWSAAIHRQRPEAQGLYWTSRKDDSAQAVMLFGDRIPAGALVTVGDSLSLLDHGPTYGAVIDLAKIMRIEIVDGLA